MSDDYRFDQAAIDSVVCPTCRAEPGHACRTLTRGIPTGTHTARWGPLAIAWGEGYQEAEDGLKQLAQAEA